MFKNVVMSIKTVKKSDIAKNILAKILISAIFLTIIYFLFIVPMTKIYMLNNSVNDLNNQIAELQKQKDEMEKELSDLEEIKNNLIVESNNSQAAIIDAQNKIVANLERVTTLRNKYGYLFEYRETHPNADFGINELMYLDDVCAEKGVPVPLMLALYEHESGFNSLAKNPSSTATGYGQLINTTARSMYNRLSRGTYDISRHRVLATDKYLNIDLSVELMSYNLKSYGGVREALNAYYGHPDPNELARYSNDIMNRMTKYQR